MGRQPLLMSEAEAKSAVRYGRQTLGLGQMQRGSLTAGLAFACQTPHPHGLCPGRASSCWLPPEGTVRDVPRDSVLLPLVAVELLSRVCFATLFTVAHQAPLSMELSRQGYWSGLPFPPPGDVPSLGIEPRSPTLQADSLPLGN